MERGAGAEAPPPIGVAARVEETPAGTRVTLRPHGMGRWIGIPFLAVWLCGWAAGEAFALYFLGGMIGKGLGLLPKASLPIGGVALAMGAFLLLWLSLWTLAGVAALWSVLRMAWGRDIVTFGPSSWIVWHGVGWCGWSRSFDPEATPRLELNGRNGALTTEIDARTVTLTDLGTGADRSWLRACLLRSLAERARETEALPERQPEPRLPGYRIEPLPDGTLRLRATIGRRLGGAGCMLFLALFWNGIVGGLVAAGLGRLPLEDAAPGGTMSPGHWGYWLVLSPFMLVGLLFIAGFVWAVLAREEWRVGSDLMELRRTFLGWSWRRRYTNGTLALSESTDSDGDVTWRLVLRTTRSKRTLDAGDPAKLRAFGRLLAAHTGWPFRPYG